MSDAVEVDEVTPGGMSAVAERRERFARLTARKRDLATQQRKLQAELDALEERIVDDYIELGTDSMRTKVDDQAYTVHLKLDVFASPRRTGLNDRGEPTSTEEDWQRACDALRAIGLGHLVGERFHAGSLGSWFDEFREQHGPGWREHLPDEVAEALRLGERQRVRVRKA